MKVGEYVRTEYGISKCIKVIPIRENSFMYEFDKEVYEDVNYLTASELEKYKSSPNIIDLIEVGDYVNGLRVEKNKYGELYTSYVYHGGDIGKQCEVYTTWLEEYKENEDWIESIVTKEQFESMQYEVK